MGRAAHVADLALASLAKPEAQEVDIVAADVDDIDRQGADHIAVGHLYRRAQDAKLVVAPASRNLDLVCLLVVVAGMSELESKVAVVRHQKQTFAILVEPAYRHDALGDLSAYEVGDSPAAERIGHRREHADRLVEHYRALALGGGEATSVDRY